MPRGDAESVASTDSTDSLEAYGWYGWEASGATDIVTLAALSSETLRAGARDTVSLGDDPGRIRGAPA